MQGCYLEKLGYWKPRHAKTYDRALVINKERIRYWLSIGALPTKGVHRILEQFDFVPKKPPPFGSKYQYEKPKKEYHEQAVRIFSLMNNVDKDLPIQEKLVRELRTLEAQYIFEENKFNPVKVEETKTTDLDSDDPNIFNRNIKFDELKRRFENHRTYSLDTMKGNDYRFNIYLRKMNKLANSRLGGLDIEGYQEYLNNLMEFKKINNEFYKDKDPNRDDKIEVEYTSNPKTGVPYAGKPKTSYYQFDSIPTVDNKAVRLNSAREKFIAILKDEIKLHRQYHHDNEKKNEEK